MAQRHLDLFYNHVFGTSSPWDPAYVNKVLQGVSGDNIKSMELELIAYFDNEGKSEEDTGYGSNFRPYDKAWIRAIAENINIDQFNNVLVYESKRRGIAVDNMAARYLPTDEPNFYKEKLFGLDYPFDRMQMSAVWVGTPLYIIGESRDRAWLLVITPEYAGWVRSTGVARVSEHFVDSWRQAAKNKLAAITKTKTSIITTDNQRLFDAYIGSVFPVSHQATSTNIMVPMLGEQGEAVIKYATLQSDQVALMPLLATPRNVSTIIKELIGRPYGWGNISFYNDCSAEMKSLFTPFGVWLPRNSASQSIAHSMVDFSSSSPEERLAYLRAYGQPLTTLIFIGGHVMLFVGEVNDQLMTYQNIWRLGPTPVTRKSIIGKSVFLPLLLNYPEDPELTSLAAKKYFRLTFLDKVLAKDVPMLSTATSLRAMMHPSQHGMMLRESP